MIRAVDDGNDVRVSTSCKTSDRQKTIEQQNECSHQDRFWSQCCAPEK